MTKQKKTIRHMLLPALLLLPAYTLAARQGPPDTSPGGWYAALDAINVTTGFPGVSAGYTSPGGWNAELSAAATWLLMRESGACAEHVTLQAGLTKFFPVQSQPGLAWGPGLGVAAGYYDFEEGFLGSQGQYVGLTAGLSLQQQVGERTCVKLSAWVLAATAQDNPYETSKLDGRLLWKSRQNGFFVAPAALRISIVHYFKEKKEK